MRALWAIFALPLLVSGCIPPGPDWQALGQRSLAIRHECEAERARGVLRTHLAAEQCADRQIRALAVAAGLPDIDVLDAGYARIQAVDAKLDRGQISPEDAKAAIAVIKMEGNSEFQRRANGRIEAGAAILSTGPVFCTRMGAGAVCN